MDVLPPAPAAGCPQCVRLAELVGQLQAQIVGLRAELNELRAQVNRHSGNSSLPPSANPPSAPKPLPKPPTGRKPGGQPGHPGHQRVRLPPERVNEVVCYVPARCGHCQSPLLQACGPDDPEPVWHQVCELPQVLAWVTEHQAHGRTCAVCGHVTWGAIPSEILAHAFGPNLTATLAFLSGCCHDSKRTVEEIVETVFGVPVSLGSVVNAEREVAAALEASYQQAQQAVREAPVKNADETGWALAGKLCWLWLAVTRRVAFFKVCAGRSRKALRQVLGENIEGVLSSDRYGVYDVINLNRRQLCWAHLKRDFQKWVDYGGEAEPIGQAGLEVVRRVFEIWRDFREGVLDRPGLQAALVPACMDLHRELEAGCRAGVPKAARFCRNVLKVFPALWTFAGVEGVEPTNNFAERTLRPAVLWRKVSFGNHGSGGCRFAERILTTVQTLRLQKRHVLAYLREAVAARRAGQAVPQLVPAGV